VLAIRRPAPVSLGLAAFAVGVAVGLGAPFWIRAVVIGGAVIGVIGAGAVRVGAALIGLGVLHGAAGRTADRARCAAVLDAGPQRLELRLLDPAPPHRGARAQVVGGWCPGWITFRHRDRDTLWAGARIEAQGRWVPRPSAEWQRADGLFVAVVVTPLAREAPGPAARLRNWLVATIGALYGTRSGMIEALVLGSRGTIDPVLSQGFARSGLVHLLSISGFHVGLVWAWVMLVMGAVGRRRQAATVAAVIVVGYVIFLGMPAPAVRAMLLAIVGAIEVHRQRNVAVGALSAAVAGLVLLFDPWTLTELGAWLSVAAMWGAIAGARWSDRNLGRTATWGVLSSSVGATLATAPISALVFGSVSAIGVGLNLVAIPLASLALPATLLSLLVAAASAPVAASLAAGAGALLNLLEFVAMRGAALPGAAVTFEPGWPPALMAVAVVAIAVWIFGTGNRLAEVRRRGIWLGALGLLGGLVMADAARLRGGSGPTLHFLDVGQGDAVVIRTGQGRWILVDAGPTSDRGDAGRRVVVPFLARHGVRRLALVVVSHAHRDHFGGLASVVGSIGVDLVGEPGLPVPDREYLALLDVLDDRQVPWRALRRGDRIAIDDVSLEVLHPDPDWPAWGVDLNENSVVLHLRVGAFDAILTGDAGVPVEERLAARMGPVEVLKVGHHGSRGATDSRWLERLKPQIAVISLGVNGYGHPAPETLGRLAAAGVPVYRTDQDGTTTVRIEGATMRVSSRRGEAVLPIHE
jgi:competence protein ComEC